MPNRRLVRAIALYDAHVRYLRAATLDDAGIRTIVLRGMQRVFDALSARDADAAAQAISAHLGDAKTDFRKTAGLPVLSGAGACAK